jgi:hypothetical protein
MRNYYPDVIAGLGENQDTPYKRIDSARTGYLKGQPDILIISPGFDPNGANLSGFAIELKTPKGWGVLSDAQREVLRKMDKQKFKTLVSNDYDEIIRAIIEYFTPDLTAELKSRNRKLKGELTKLKRKTAIIHCITRRCKY